MKQRLSKLRRCSLVLTCAPYREIESTRSSP
jgi:hypothetical protein